MSKDCLRTGDKALIHFRFIKHPEYMTPGQRMVFREVTLLCLYLELVGFHTLYFQGRTKAVGNVVRIITQSTPTHQGNRTKQHKQQRHGSMQNSQKVGQENKNENNMQGVSKAFFFFCFFFQVFFILNYSSWFCTL